ncbi:hypothetical protein lbkm_3036 [Lachnospiraceae bacterium KM106-2]|nr:hypothetical protein lbkm_3036 [Lachnospiraceae bacterium KM106-2]
MKKRIISFLLVLTMVLGLVGCGSKEKGSTASLADTQKQLQDIKSGEFSMEMNLKMNVSSTSSTDATSQMMAEVLKKGFNVKLSGVVESETKCDVNIAYNLGDGNYKDVTNLIVDNDTIYINMKKIKEFVSGISQLSMYASFVPADKEYLKISKSDIEKYASMSGVDASASVNMPTEDTVKEYEEFAQEIAKAIDQAAKGVKPTVITNDGDKLSISLTKENLPEFLQNVSKLDLEKYYDGFLKIAEKTNTSSTSISELKTKKSENIADIKKSLKKAAVAIKADSSKTTGSFNIDITTTGKKGSYKVDENVKFNMKHESESMEVGAKYSISEKTEKKVTAPTDIMTLDELMTTMQSLLGSFQGTGTN